MVPVSYTHLDVYKRQVRDVAGATLTRRLVAVTRQSKPAPALVTLLDAVRDQVRALGFAPG